MRQTLADTSHKKCDNKLSQQNVTISYHNKSEQNNPHFIFLK